MATEEKFQFHKGTIRTCLPSSVENVKLYFNSIKVQLEHSFLIALTTSRCYFNSIKVQLEHSRFTRSWVARLFQFHKGTIRTVNTNFNWTLKILFQFHKGTIRTCKVLRPLRWIIPTFQFHKGTIRTRWKPASLAHLRHFNSIKVQLEHDAVDMINSQQLFQFHKGTIRTTLLTFWATPIGDFNSIKVQLEREISVNAANALLLFQFHKGTIRTLFYRCLAYFSIISIP